MSMLKTFLLIILLPTFYLNAQNLYLSNTYFGANTQYAAQTIVDKSDSRYTLVSYNSDFIIDSSGTSVLIQRKTDPRDTLYEDWAAAFIKYDSVGKYLFHFKFCLYMGSSTTTSNQQRNPNFLVQIDDSNNLIIAATFTDADSIDFYHSNGALFKRVYIPTKQDPTVVLICKVGPGGVFQWSNTILNKWKHAPSDSISLYYTRVGKALSQNINHDILMDLDLYEMYQPYIDTFSLIYSNGTDTPIYVSQKDPRIIFSRSGKLINYHTPYQLKVNSSATFTEILSAVTIGNNTYTLLKITPPSIDTLLTPVPIPLGIGENIILIKSDINNTIIGGTYIGFGNPQLFIQPFMNARITDNFHLEYDPFKQNVVIGFTFYSPGFTLGSSSIALINNSLYNIIIAKIDGTGGISSYKVYSGSGPNGIRPKSLTFHNQTKGLVLIGEAFARTLQLDSIHLIDLLPLGFSRHFFAYIDSLFTCVSAQWVYGRPFIGSNFGEDIKLGLGRPITNSKGQTFVSGTYMYNTYIPCVPPNPLVFNNVEGFVYSMIPPSNSIDTGVCKIMISPSGRCQWDSTATYFDTIPSKNGCDSILKFRVTILQTKSAIDSSVCKSLKSPSGKHTWDTSGTYMDTIPNIKGCDSVMTIRLTILQSKSVIDSSVCANFKSPSGKYSWDSSGTYMDTIINSKGCDSMITFRLIILQTKSTLDTTHCGIYTSPSGKYHYDSTGIYTDTILNTKGCDSIITIRFTKLNLKGNIDTTTCGTMLSPSGKYIYDSTGVYTDTIPSVMGCDSIITIRYTKPSTQSSIIKNSCDSLISPSGKYVYTITGNYRDTIPNSQNCDSIIFIQLTVLPLHIRVTKSNDLSCDTPSAQLKVTGGNTFVWSPTIGLSDPFSQNPIVKTDQKMVYHITVNDTLGCSTEDSIEVLVNKQETLKQLANVFTPNNDGLNDCLSIQSIGQLKEVSLSIYNRWGAMVYETSNPSDCWNGKDKQGSDVATGTYYFLAKGISTCDTKIQQHGTIQVIR